MIKKLLLAATLAPLGALVLGAQSNAVDPALPRYQSNDTISGELATLAVDTMDSYMKNWITAFNQLHSRAKVLYATKETDPADRSTLGPNCEEVFSNTSSAFSDKYHYEPFRVKVSMGCYDLAKHVRAYGVFVNKANPITQLTLAQLDAMYSDQRRRGHPADIKTWGDVGLTGEWADKPVHPYGRRVDIDIAWHFKDIVMYDAEFKRTYIAPPGKDGVGNSADVVNGVAADKYGIGYAAFGYVTNDVKAIALGKPDGTFVQPTKANVANGSYPIGRPLYLYVNRPPGAALDPLAKEFLLFVLSREGQEILAQDGTLPLPAPDAAAERAKLE
jgi:phosphate transport system substrate-binding protein